MAAYCSNVLDMRNMIRFAMAKATNKSLVTAQVRPVITIDQVTTDKLQNMELCVKITLGLLPYYTFRLN